MKEIKYKRTANIVNSYCKEYKLKIETVLDLGCNFPVNLFELYHLIGIKNGVGVDRNKFENSDRISFKAQANDYLIRKDSYIENEVEKRIGNLKKAEYDYPYSENWIYHDQYLKLCKVILEKEPLSLIRFNEVFDLTNFGETIEDFLARKSIKYENFDLIIVSKVLSHLEVFRLNLIDDILEFLNIRGIIFFRLNSEGFQFIKRKFDNDLISKIIGKIRCDWGPFIETSVNSNQKHIVFIGRKV